MGVMVEVPMERDEFDEYMLVLKKNKIRFAGRFFKDCMERKVAELTAGNVDPSVRKVERTTPQTKRTEGQS